VIVGVPAHASEGIGHIPADGENRFELLAIRDRDPELDPSAERERSPLTRLADESWPQPWSFRGGDQPPSTNSPSSQCFVLIQFGERSPQR
jgi:hypothetical protein